ncbi:hypothetical protein AAFX91_41605, partial [Bradyrhizobium sp. 31Argb]|uniref:hypothetical protein n=1 Tax=Bradyrhizobium sp. 31Argb TaxID=3141247 RepID=UPI0037481AB8
LARFICPSFFGPDSNSFWRKYSVAGHCLSNVLRLRERIDFSENLKNTRRGSLTAKTFWWDWTVKLPILEPSFAP